MLGCENLLFQIPVSGTIKSSDFLTEIPIEPSPTRNPENCSLTEIMSKADLRQAVGITSNAMTKLNRGEEVTLEILREICGILKINVRDIVDI